MEISLQILLFLHPELHICQSEVNTKRSFHYLLPIQEDQPCIDPIALYVGEWEQVIAMESAWFSNAMLALTGASEEQCEILSKKFGGVCFSFPPEYSAGRAYRELQKTVSELSEWSTEMDELVCTCNNVQELFDKAEKIITDPVLAWNPAFEKMATLNTEKIAPEDMPELMASFLENHGWTGAAVDTMIKKHDYLTMPMRYMDVRVLEPPNMMNCYSCARNFSLSGKIVMTAGVYYLNGRRPHEGQIQLLRLFFSKIVRFFKLNTNTFIGSKKIYERFILDLIEGKLTNQTDIRDRLNYLYFPYNGDFEVLSIRCSSNVQPMALGLVRNYCKSFFRHAKFIEYHNQLVGLNNRQRDTSADLEHRKEIFKDHNNVNDFSLGISSIFHCLIDTEEAFNQARIALQYGVKIHPEQKYYEYNELFVYYMLNQMKPSASSIYSCPDASYIYRLRELDRRKKGMDNERLFVTYILNGNNTSKTAEIINMHRNSVLYRINQIEHMLGVDLTKAETIFHMILWIKAVELQDVLARETELEEQPDEKW